MNRLKETFYIVMIILGLLALSFHLANAQVRPPVPDNDNQRIIYMSGDTVFEKRVEGKRMK